MAIRAKRAAVLGAIVAVDLFTLYVVKLDVLKPAELFSAFDLLFRNPRAAEIARCRAEFGQGREFGALSAHSAFSLSS